MSSITAAASNSNATPARSNVWQQRSAAVHLPTPQQKNAAVAAQQPTMHDTTTPPPASRQPLQIVDHNSAPSSFADCHPSTPKTAPRPLPHAAGSTPSAYSSVPVHHEQSHAFATPQRPSHVYAAGTPPTVSQQMYAAPTEVDGRHLMYEATEYEVTRMVPANEQLTVFERHHEWYVVDGIGLLLGYKRSAPTLVPVCAPPTPPAVEMPPTTSVPVAYRSALCNAMGSATRAAVAAPAVVAEANVTLSDTDSTQVEAGDDAPQKPSTAAAPVAAPARRTAVRFASDAAKSSRSSSTSSGSDNNSTCSSESDAGSRRVPVRPTAMSSATRTGATAAVLVATICVCSKDTYFRIPVALHDAVAPDTVVVFEGDRGDDAGEVIGVKEESTFTAKSLPPVVRVATRDDAAKLQRLRALDKGPRLDRVRRLLANAPLQVVECHTQLFGKSMTVCYTADHRVKHNGFACDLFREFQCRVWMRQLNYHECAAAPQRAAAVRGNSRPSPSEGSKHK